MAYLNGRLPSTLLAVVAYHLRVFKIRHYARSSAAKWLERLDAHFFDDRGEHIKITDSYRSINGQWSVWRSKRHLAAYPGTSVHGWGLAFDLGSGINVRSSEAHKWMQRYAGRYGFFNPNWATPGAPGFQKDEPWHWEFDSKLIRRALAIIPTFNKAVRKEWQRQLGIKADGIFGMGSTMELQTTLNRKNGHGGFELKSGDLKVDGHAGSRTWAAVQKLINVWAERGAISLTKPLKITGKLDRRTKMALRKTLNAYLWE